MVTWAEELGSQWIVGACLCVCVAGGEWGRDVE